MKFPKPWHRKGRGWYVTLDGQQIKLGKNKAEALKKYQRWHFPESEAKTDLPRVVYLTDDALAITQRLMARYPMGKLFRNTKGVAWTTDAVNCAFSSIQIRLGRRILDQRTRQVDKPADKRRKYVVDDAAVTELMKTLNPLKRSGVEKTDAELLHEARRKLAYRQAKHVGPKYCLNHLRHTWMNRLLKQGVDALTVAFLAGHADPSTLAKVYAHLSQDPEYLLKQVKKAAG